MSIDTIEPTTKPPSITVEQCIYQCIYDQLQFDPYERAAKIIRFLDIAGDNIVSTTDQQIEETCDKIF